MDDSRLCVICLERPRSHILLHCAHMCAACRARRATARDTSHPHHSTRRCVCGQCAPMFEPDYEPSARRQTMCPLCKEPVAKVSIVYQ